MVRRFVIRVLLACLTLSATARTRPHYGGTLRIETQGDPWQMPDGIARRLVLDTLTTVSDAGGAQPALAVRWESQNAAHRWEFWIRPGVHFQDGDPLTSDAVAAALTDVCCPGSGRYVPVADGARRGSVRGVHQRFTRAGFARAAGADGVRHCPAAMPRER